MKKTFLISLLLVMTGCSSLPKKNEEEKQMTTDQAQQTLLHKIEELISDNQCDQALGNIEFFRKKYHETSYFQTSRLMEARCLNEVGKHQEAISLYQIIEQAPLDKNPKLWAQARYESSFSYEDLGDNVKTLSILYGLEK